VQEKISAQGCRGRVGKGGVYLPGGGESQQAACATGMLIAPSRGGACVQPRGQLSSSVTGPMSAPPS